MVAWHNLASGTADDHDDWHSREHLFERIAIPGFLRGRRHRALEATEDYFLMYEVEELATLTSPAYLERLNAPTPWSQRVIPTIRDMTRTLCRVEASHGGGVGSHLLTVRLSALPTHRADLLCWLKDLLLPSVNAHPGVTGTHLLLGDSAASAAPTDEQRLRGGGDRCADMVLVIEAYQPAALESLAIEPLSAHHFIEQGAENTLQVGLYQLAHLVMPNDVSSIPSSRQ